MKRLPHGWLWLLALAIPWDMAGAASKPPTGPISTYRWVDEQGVTHYSDQVPPEDTKHRRAKLNAQGQEIAVIDAPKTAEQLKREQQLKQLRTQQDKILAEQRDRDLSLLRTYRNEDEMFRALKGKLDTLDSLVKLSEANRQHQQELLTTQQQRAADLERQGQAVPQNLRDQIAATRRQITDSNDKIRRLETDKKSLIERFDKDMARYRAIAAQQKSLGDSLGLSAGLGSTSSRNTANDEIVISAIACTPGAVCNRAWELARTYVLKHAGPHLSLETERILQTPPPSEDGRFGLTVTRIIGKSEDILFLDVRCRPDSLGEELCAGPEVRGVRAGFKPYIEAGIAGSPDPIR